MLTFESMRSSKLVLSTLVLHLCSRNRMCTEYSVGDSTMVALFLLLTSVAYSCCLLLLLTPCCLLVLLFMEPA